MSYKITKILVNHKAMIREFLTKRWGDYLIITRGRKHLADELPGFVVLDNDKVVGLITLLIEESDCEIVTLDSVIQKKGIGKSLLEFAENYAKNLDCKRIWLITTNDNLDAIRFYQKNDYDLVKIHRDTIQQYRKLKPTIPKIGIDGIPIKHEIEMEKLL